MLKLGEINPLAVFGLRKLEHCPPHFERVIFPHIAQQKVIEDWIWENLSGRFFVGIAYGDDYPNKDMHLYAGFEVASEATYFSLCLDQINTLPF